MSVRPANTQISLGIRPVWSVFAVHSRTQGFFMRTVKTMIRLGGCPGWSESSLGEHSFCWFCHVLAHLCLVSHIWDLGKQWRPRSDAAPGSILFFYRNFDQKWNKKKCKSTPDTPKFGNGLVQLISMEKSTGQIWVNLDVLRKAVSCYTPRRVTSAVKMMPSKYMKRQWSGNDKIEFHILPLTPNGKGI